MLNLRIGKNLVSIHSHDIDSHETTTESLLELIDAFARAAALHYLIIDDSVSERTQAAISVSVDIEDFLNMQP